MFAKTSLLIAFLGSCLIAPLQADTAAKTAVTQRQHMAPDEVAWKNYLAISKTLRQLDQDFLTAELAKRGQTTPSLPEYTKEFGFEVNQAPNWFKGPEGKRVMEVILSFQTPSGGWSKRTDMSKAPRQPGQAFGVEEDYIPTFDNGATSTQLMLLAQAHHATGDKRYAAAFSKGLDFILTAQYPNGG